MESTIILDLQIKDRVKESGRTQDVLTGYSQNIKTRLGFHEVNEDMCSCIGLVLLELRGGF